MGQHSSKRRSYTPGQDVNSEIPSNTIANGDVKYDASANGGIEAYHKDAQLRAPTSLTPVEQQPPAGKKDKRKKIRIIGITLRRTSSGRWTRKRRSMRANGSTRPVSCPVPSQSSDSKGTQPRPQSLFEEEVVNEEDGKIETVDLSDHEDGNKGDEATAAADPVPKPRDKKGKQSSSDKKQSSKKKKEKKKSSKKDKPKKLSSPKSTKAPDIPAAELNTNAESADSKSNAQDDTEDINKMASSIVQESISIARDKLIAEQDAAEHGDATQNEDVDSPDSAQKPVSEIMEAPKSVTDIESSPTPEKDSPPEVEEEIIIACKAPEKEMAPIVLQMGQTEEEEDEKDQETEEKPEQTIDVQVEVVQPEIESVSAEISEPPTEILNVMESSPVVEVEEVVEEAIVQEKVENVKTLPFPIASFPNIGDDKDIENFEENETDKKQNEEENGKKSEIEGNTEGYEYNVESGATVSDGTVEIEVSRKESDESKTNDDEASGDAAVSDADTEKALKAKLSKELKEKEKEEKERIKKQKEEEKAKEKERLKEEKRKKAEQKALEKEKHRDKSDKKSPISKRLSGWFKRDKPLTKDSSDADVPSDAISDKNPESPSELESANLGLTDSVQSDSLTVDVSVEPLSNLVSNELDESMNPSSPTDSTSPDSAPISPVSNDISSDPATPTSDGEKYESSGGLKKILLGPRLRTAILRKKSSSASDSGSEDKRVSLTQPKGVETSDITAPPRKLRPRKPVEQYSPVTVGAHNPMRSPSPRPDCKERDSLTINADLNTSVEESLPKEDESVSKDKTDSVDDESKNITEVEDTQLSSLNLEDMPHSDVAVVVTEIEIVSEKPLSENICIEDSHVPEETHVESSQTLNVSVEPQSDISPVSVTEEMLEPSHSQDVSLEPQLQTESLSLEVVKTDIVETVSNSVTLEDEEKTSLAGDKDEIEPSEENSDDETALESPTLISKASIVLQAVSTEVGESDSQGVESKSPLEDEIQEAPSTLLSEQCEHKDDPSSVLLINENNSESKEENVSSNDKVDHAMSDENDDTNNVQIIPSSGEVTEQTEEETDESPKELISNVSEDENEKDEVTSGMFKVICTAQSVEVVDVNNEEKPETSEMPSQDSDVNIPDNDASEEKDTCEETVSNTQDSSSHEVTSDSNDDIVETSPASSGSNHWESPKLDIQLDDSAIEMDKESPLAETQSPVSSDGSMKHEDEGVNSDNSSENNDNGHENNDKNIDSNKTDSSATIEAYLKLQHVDVKDLSIKNHVENGLMEAQVLKNDDSNDLKDEQDTSAPFEA